MTTDSSSPPVVVVGAGGHGREIFMALRESATPCAGFVDDRRPDESLLKKLGGTWLGPVSELGRLREHPYLLGVGSGAVRRALDAQAERAGCTPATLIHPSSLVGDDVAISPGVVVFAFATVTTNVSLGRHTHVGRGCAVGHDSKLGDYVSLYPLSSVSGAVTLGDECAIGTTASVNQGLSIGHCTVVGAGAAVVHDLPAHVTAVGVPARVH